MAANQDDVIVASYLNKYIKSRSIRVGRVNKFVISSRPPCRLGVSAEDSVELLKMAENTMNVLAKKSRSSRVCKFPLFLGLSDVPSIHMSHNPRTYARLVARETQLPAEYHIIGHGEPGGVGGASPSDRRPPEEIADLFHTDLGDLGMLRGIKNTPVDIVFHSCNSAYVDMTGLETQREMADAIINESFIGRFTARLQAHGYNNFRVYGFRGFYQSMTTAGGARVIDDPYFPSCDFDAEKAKFSITVAGPRKTVDIPRNCRFPVYNVSSGFFDESGELSSSPRRDHRVSPMSMPPLAQGPESYTKVATGERRSPEKPVTRERGDSGLITPPPTERSSAELKKLQITPIRRVKAIKPVDASRESKHVDASRESSSLYERIISEVRDRDTFGHSDSAFSRELARRRSGKPSAYLRKIRMRAASMKQMKKARLNRCQYSDHEFVSGMIRSIDFIEGDGRGCDDGSHLKKTRSFSPESFYARFPVDRSLTKVRPLRRGFSSAGDLSRLDQLDSIDKLLQELGEGRSAFARSISEGISHSPSRVLDYKEAAVDEEAQPLFYLRHCIEAQQQRSRSRLSGSCSPLGRLCLSPSSY